MSFLPQVLFFAALVITLVSVIVYAKRVLGARGNAVTAMKFFESMDVISNGQRYRGERSEILMDGGSGPTGTGGYQLLAVCRTKSGRGYFLRVISQMCFVSEWEIIPLSPEEFEEFLKLEETPESPDLSANQVEA